MLYYFVAALFSCSTLKCGIIGEPFQKVQAEVHKLLSGRIVVGHSLKNDFKVSLQFAVHYMYLYINFLRDQLVNFFFITFRF